MQSILATFRVPQGLLLDTKDIKDGLTGHFAQFGTIQRVSCTTKGKEKVAHFQFSSPKEARDAKANGNTVPGLTLNITLTQKQPNTQIIQRPPLPRICTLFESGLNAQARPQLEIRNYPCSQPQQTTINSFFRPDTFRSQTQVPQPQNPEPQPRISTSTPVKSTPVTSPDVKETKPNTCVKIEVYEGPPSQSQQSQSISARSADRQWSASTPDLVSAAQQQVQNFWSNFPRPTRTLSQILNVDITAVKVVPRVYSSDALACQLFFGGQYPFPLAQMFGRAPGMIIMPEKSIVESIKSGMEIKESTLKLIWNSVEESVIRSYVRESASKVLASEKFLSPLSEELFESIQEDVMSDLIESAAEQQYTAEEELMICCEDCMEEILGKVCNDLVEASSTTQHDFMKVVNEVAESQCDALEREEVENNVRNSALDEFLNDLCGEVIEDLIECPYLNGFVRIIAKKALKERSDPIASLPETDSTSKILTWIAELPDSKTVTQSIPSKCEAWNQPSGNGSDGDSEEVSSASSVSRAADKYRTEELTSISQQFSSQNSLNTTGEMTKLGRIAAVFGSLKRRASSIFQFPFKRLKRGEGDDQSYR